MSDVFSELNEAQKSAVLYSRGPLMIIAGAGSGKTKTLTARVAYLIKSGVAPFQILALTFTNKAAFEMKERIYQMLQDEQVKNLFIGTFHSIFARILRVEAEAIGYPRAFSIYDSTDSKNIIKRIVQNYNLNKDYYKENKLAGRISSLKNQAVLPEMYAQNRQYIEQDSQAQIPEFARIYKAYCQECFKSGGMDFDDILLQMYLMLAQSPQLLYKYQHKFTHILVDEYQDTNPLQYKIIKLLAGAYENICVVGDDAQSIYGFRGADIGNILQFEKDYPETKVIKLEQNYRSSKTILSAANELIKHNQYQIDKELWTLKEAGEKIRFAECKTDHEEARYVGDAIAEQKLRYHYAHKEFAILYRTNAQSRTFEERLRKMNIPYKIYGGLSFYDREEVKDFMAYLKLTLNLRDNESLRRIINKPKRGIGETSFEKCVIFANDNDLSVWEALPHAAQLGVRGASLECMGDFVQMITYFNSLIHKYNAYDIAQEVGKRTGLVRHYFNDKSTEGLSKFENIETFLNSIKAFVDGDGVLGGEAQDTSLEAYLQEVLLLTAVDNFEENARDHVHLMTVHNAKGLEFKCVFVVGMEEELFPSIRSSFSVEALEEERRLFYVAITRAREKLWLSLANERYSYGQLRTKEPSRFLQEIPEACLHKQIIRSPGLQERRFQMYRPAEKGVRRIIPPAAPKQAPFRPNPDFQPTLALDLLVADTPVEHMRFGNGVIVCVENAPTEPIATIRFDSGEEKRILLKYAKLRIRK